MNRKLAIRIGKEEVGWLQSSLESFCSTSAKLEELYKMCCVDTSSLIGKDTNFVATHLSQWRKNMNAKSKKARLNSKKEDEIHPFLLVQQEQFYSELQTLLASNSLTNVASDVILMLDFGIHYCNILLEQDLQYEESVLKGFDFPCFRTRMFF